MRFEKEREEEMGQWWMDHREVENRALALKVKRVVIGSSYNDVLGVRGPFITNNSIVDVHSKLHIRLGGEEGKSSPRSRC